MTNSGNDKISETINQLNDLLANYAVYYQNLRSMHWNVTGLHFFTLHEKFEEEYNDAQEMVDEIAERILSLGGKPKSTFSVYLKDSEISEFSEYENAEKTIGFLVENLETLLEKENKILEQASENNDEGTADLMTMLISKQEKNRWMFRATIK